MTGYASKKMSGQVRWLGPYAPTDDTPDGDGMETTYSMSYKEAAYRFDLRVENERLRKALQCISNSSEDWGGFAEAALKEGE
jgi:hypothetical protein